MSKFGFEDPLDFSDLPKNPSKSKLKADDSLFQQEATSLGYTDRTPEKSSITKKPLKRKPGRKPPVEPKKNVLISGPESIISEFQNFCEANGNLPYWEGLKLLMNQE
jgi:hypothetical protein